jgi:hypothetical protein
MGSVLRIESMVSVSEGDGGAGGSGRQFDGVNGERDPDGGRRGVGSVGVSGGRDRE